MTTVETRVQKIPVEYKKDMTLRMTRHIKARQGYFNSWKLSDFEIGVTLGQGRFGKVYLAREKTTKFSVALKVVKRGPSCGELTREISIQSQLKHSRILPLYSYFSHESSLVLILEFAPRGELYSLMKRQPYGRFRQDKAPFYIYQVCDAVEYCHSKNIMHRDIKPENILLDARGNVKLSDFGCSIQVTRKGQKAVCGTLDYLPPEIVMSREYGLQVDNWNIGVLAYELVVGVPPFRSKTKDLTLSRIVSGQVAFPVFIASLTRNFICSLLKIEPGERLPLVWAMKHRWIVENQPMF